MLRARSISAAALVATIALVGGCSGDSPTNAAPVAPSSASSSASSATVDANTASEAEIATALAANGVASSGRWAKEVVEYRPYPTDDPSFAKLKANLAKYKPSQETLDAIIASLTL